VLLRAVVCRVRFYVQGTPRGGIRRLMVVEYRPV